MLIVIWQIHTLEARLTGVGFCWYLWKNVWLSAMQQKHVMTVEVKKGWLADQPTNESVWFLAFWHNPILTWPIRWQLVIKSTWCFIKRLVVWCCCQSQKTPESCLSDRHVKRQWCLKAAQRGENNRQITRMKRSKEGMKYTKYEENRHGAFFPTIHQQSTSSPPMFMLLRVLWQSSRRSCITSRAGGQATTQTQEMSTQTADRHMHTCPEAEARLSGAYQQSGTWRRDICRLMSRRLKVSTEMCVPVCWKELCAISGFLSVTCLKVNHYKKPQFYIYIKKKCMLWFLLLTNRLNAAAQNC